MDLLGYSPSVFLTYLLKFSFLQIWLCYSAEGLAIQIAALKLKLLMFYPLCIIYPKQGWQLYAWSQVRAEKASKPAHCGLECCKPRSNLPSPPLSGGLPLCHFHTCKYFSQQDPTGAGKKNLTLALLLFHIFFSRQREKKGLKKFF